MATINVNKLYTKKWRGVEIGGLIINCITEAVQQKSNGYQPKFSTHEIERMSKGLRDSQEIQNYSNYVNVYNACLCGFNQSQVYMQQIRYGFYRMCSTITDEIKNSRTPAIITQKQANEYIRRSAPILGGYLESYVDILYRSFLCFVKDYNSSAESVPQTIKNVLEAYKQERLTKEEIVNSLSKEIDQTRRSEDLYSQIKRLKKWKALCAGILPQNEAYELIDNNKLKPIQEISKHDVITGDYRCVFIGHYLPPSSDNDNNLKYLLTFAEDFPELFKAIIIELSQFKELEDINNIPIELYPTKSISQETLASIGVADYASHTYTIENSIKEACELAGNNDSESEECAYLSALYLQIKRNGVAIIQEPQKGKETDINTFTFTKSQPSLFKPTTNIMETLHAEVNQLLIPSIKLIFAYNIAIGLLADRYGNNELNKLKQNIDELPTQVEALNNLALYLQVEKTYLSDDYYDDPEESQPLLNLESYKPSLESIEKVKSRLNSSKNSFSPLMFDELILTMANDAVLNNSFIRPFKT